MKLLVFSDSHGQIEPMRHAIERERPDTVIHLGDCVRDAENLRREISPTQAFISVCGNCDPGSDAPDRAEFVFDGVSVFACHGHRYRVKFGLESLCLTGQLSGAQLVLFGHTHAALCQELGGLTLVNPGSAAHSYAVVETDGAGGFKARLLSAE